MIKEIKTYSDNWVLLINSIMVAAIEWCFELESILNLANKLAFIISLDTDF